MYLGRFRNSEESEIAHFSERLRSTNRALHCAFRGHFVSDLLAMRLHSISANAYALESLFVCHQPAGVHVAKQHRDKSREIPCLCIKKYHTKCMIFFWWTKTFRYRSKMKLKNSLIKIEKPTV